MIAPEGYTSVAAIEREIIDEIIKAKEKVDDFNDAGILAQARIITAKTLSPLAVLSLFRPEAAAMQISSDVLRYELDEDKPNFLFVNPKTWQPSLGGIHEEMKKYSDVISGSSDNHPESDYGALFFILGLTGLNYLVAHVPQVSEYFLAIKTEDASSVRAVYAEHVGKLFRGEIVDHENMEALESAYQARCNSFRERGARPTKPENDDWYACNTVAGKKITRSETRRLRDNYHPESWKRPGIF